MGTRGNIWKRVEILGRLATSGSVWTRLKASGESGSVWQRLRTSESVRDRLGDGSGTVWERALYERLGAFWDVWERDSVWERLVTLGEH